MMANASSTTSRPGSPSKVKALRDIALEVHAGLNSVSSAAQAAVVASYFDEDSRFSDPIVLAQSTDLIRGVFSGNLLAFSAIDKRILSVTESSSAPMYQQDLHVVCIDADVCYTFKLLPFTAKIRTVSKFTLNRHTGKVVDMEDVWSFMDLIEQIPLLGPLYSESVRPFLGAATQFVAAKLIGVPAPATK
ncbi:hypothetical protein H9P43_001149 [Blastocladiella emersonii ATCC 22665]|nr:hypothetical protein H9P43_001149 [Blastocladiella emersonii ATCC 22665]